ncbi:MAG: amino acid ABC transporter permease [Acidaminococcus sp.]|uniref:amino acid ABC transporter permease n=1 Tax=Acidaminococcus sp. TaxID=1872103 RepID=UPI0026DF6F8F|nr:amino acid ABC transporter permease [Acidaminococcus sp.]MDO5598295.1 amino acid ABC transporter permease [Acidaminococcus sp.]
MGGLFSEKAWAVVLAHKANFIQGFGVTLESAIGGILIALVLGVLLGLMGVSTRKLPHTINRIYVEAIQNTPLILQLCLLYYACSFSGHKIGILTAGIVALGIYHGAYMAEVIRAGIEAVPRGQFEAADAQGFDYTQKMAYIILPPSVNQVGNLIKNTAVLYIIGGADLISSTYNFVTGATTGGAYAPAYIVCGVLFFVICFPLSTLAGKWEAKLKAQDEMMNA